MALNLQNTPQVVFSAQGSVGRDARSVEQFFRVICVRPYKEPSPDPENRPTEAHHRPELQGVITLYTEFLSAPFYAKSYIIFY